MAEDASRAESATVGARSGAGPLLAGALLFAVAAWRARYGISIFDSSHYTVAGIRLADGIRPFVDDMTLQATGFLAAGPFSKLWMLAFGRFGIELALRLFFVALAAVAAVIVFRALRPSFGPWPSLLAASLPLLAPPYNILALSYNTSAILAFVVAAALSFAAVRDDSRAAAICAGVAFALGAVSYPPMVIGAVVGFIAFVAVARSRRLAAWMLAGAAGTAGAIFVWLLLSGSLSGLQATMELSATLRGGGVQTPLQRLNVFLPYIEQQFTRRAALPAWLLAVVALLPLPWRRARAVALGLIPLALALPAVRHVTPAQTYIGVVGAVTLIGFGVVALVPVTVSALAESHRDQLRLLWLAAPPALVNACVVVYSTNAGWSRGTAYAGFAPLAMALVALWMRFVIEKGGAVVGAAAGVSLAAVVVALLFATSFKDGLPSRMAAPVTEGAYAGLLTTPEQARNLKNIEAIGRRSVRADDSILVCHAPGVYLLVPGRIDTNATWLDNGPADRFAIDYFRRRNDMPDIIVAHRKGSIPAPANDPLLQVVARDYRLVDGNEQLVFFRRR